jgi:nucleotide-binding universal stress UspA family protein
MKPIVCATRGGEACRRTQERAIDLAKQRDAELIFLFVADPTDVGPVDESLVEALKGEIERLGRALLRTAQGRAQKQGLTAQAVVLHGPVEQSIKDYLRQTKAGALVIGAPRTGAAPQAFTREGIQRFAQAVRQETDVEVVVVI